MRKRLLVLGIAFSFLFLFSLLLDSFIVSSLPSIRTPYLDDFFSWLTDFASVIVIFMMITTLFLIQEHKKAWIFPMWASFGIAVVISYSIKFLVARPRPNQDLFYQVFTSLNHSFPSMHAMVVFAVLPIVVKEFPALKYWWIILAILVAFSRLYFSYHYLSDVVFGAIIGGIIGMLMLTIEKKYKPFSFLQ